MHLQCGLAGCIVKLFFLLCAYDEAKQCQAISLDSDLDGQGEGML